MPYLRQILFFSLETDNFTRKMKNMGKFTGRSFSGEQLRKDTVTVEIIFDFNKRLF